MSEIFDTFQISDRVWCIRTKDKTTKKFDGLVPLSEGTSYNSYIIKGATKNVLIDTTKPGYEEGWLEAVSLCIDPSTIDYLIMNHAEPDHGGMIPFFLAKFPKVKLITSSIGQKFAGSYYNVTPSQIQVVTEADTIDLGDIKLSFIASPMLHWPESMFTYADSEEILFSSDFFGLHSAEGKYNTELANTMDLLKSYFGEIMMPYRERAVKVMEKVEALKIKKIAPSHGPIHTEIKSVINSYNSWIAGTTQKNVIIVYATMWQNTASLAKHLHEYLSQKNIDVKIFNLADADLSDIVREVVDAGVIVLGAPTFVNGLHPDMIYFANLAKIIKPPTKNMAILESHGWGGGAVSAMKAILEPLAPNLLGIVDVVAKPTAEDLKRVEVLGEEIVKQMSKS